MMIEEGNIICSFSLVLLPGFIGIYKFAGLEKTRLAGLGGKYWKITLGL